MFAIQGYGLLVTVCICKHLRLSHFTICIEERKNGERTHGIMFAIRGYGLRVCICLTSAFVSFYGLHKKRDGTKKEPMGLCLQYEAVVCIYVYVHTHVCLILQSTYKRDTTRKEPMGLCLPYEVIVFAYTYMYRPTFVHIQSCKWPNKTVSTEQERCKNPQD